jgi:hypothetical protein
LPWHGQSRSLPSSRSYTRALVWGQRTDSWGRPFDEALCADQSTFYREIFHPLPTTHGDGPHHAINTRPRGTLQSTAMLMSYSAYMRLRGGLHTQLLRSLRGAWCIPDPHQHQVPDDEDRLCGLDLDLDLQYLPHIGSNQDDIILTVVSTSIVVEVTIDSLVHFTSSCLL